MYERSESYKELQRPVESGSIEGLMSTHHAESLRLMYEREQSYKKLHDDHGGPRTVEALMQALREEEGTSAEPKKGDERKAEPNKAEIETAKSEAEKEKEERKRQEKLKQDANKRAATICNTTLSRNSRMADH